ncbi:hypothetical protein CTA1_6283 [Colletotrichum tanaceti]|uniref:Uncharacterized protein n=1 Tax=Colletotrichum tanaceti TaxID=1306861 RepID=A0A4U6X954_9PEZI|nr:hypothetical protein CTA1_6283 [Colletotrichum tanaceti]
MQLNAKSVLLAVAAALASTAAASPASPLTPRQAADEPKADCCSCDLQNPGPNYICRVPPAGVCAVPAIACPHDPATQEQCCCCDISVPAMRCKAVAKGSGCFCTKVKCPFQFDESFLPSVE